MAAVDPDVDDNSPWMRDDWIGTEAPRCDAFTSPGRSPSPAPARGLSASQGPDRPPASIESSEPRAGVDDAMASPRPRQRMAAAAIVAAVVLAVVSVVVVRGDDPAGPADAAPVTDAPNTPADASIVAEPLSTTTLDAVSAELAARSAAEERATVGAAARAGAAGGVTPAVAVSGEVPAWTEWRITVGEPLGGITVATEVVALSGGGVLHRLELPSGNVRSLVLPEPNREWKLAVGDTSILAYDQRDIVVIRDDRPVQRLGAPESLLFVQPWPATTSFIATMTPSPGLDAERVLLDVDTGTVRPLTADVTDALRFGAASFLASGALLVGRAGGVYAIGPDQQGRRLDIGSLLAVGRHHYAVETCDETMRCTDSVVDVRTGDRVAAELAGLAPLGLVDPSSHISPDGRSVVFTDATRDTGYRQILEAATGGRVDIGRLRGIYSSDTWAADSSGLFTLDDGRLRFQTRDTLEAVGVDDFGDVDRIAVRQVNV